jgi:tRNA modification GTPase
MRENETIYATSTALGKSAITLVRISGTSSIKGIESISTNMPKASNKATFNKLITGSGEEIDQTITTIFKSPKSFTGEDMVEVSLHGGSAVLTKFLKELSKIKNFRLANAGEFTRRAFENNKLDLTQVEAISDIISAETEMQRKQAISHLSGNFFKRSKKTLDLLKKILANIEAVIDFSDEDLPKNILFKNKEQIKNIIISIKKNLDNSSSGLLIRSGFLVVIMGKPNTGKSSFMNKISDKEVAIVTDVPGTTRDILESFVDIDGYPFKFLDTAGIRKSQNSIEKIGIDLAIKASKESLINLVFIDNKKDIPMFKEIKNSIFIKSKQDLNNKPFLDSGYFNVSSETGYGITDILSVLKSKITSGLPQEPSFISRERHINCLEAVIMHLENSQIPKNIDLFAEDLRLSIKEFSNLFGSVEIDDILDIIFSDFCIGK